MKYLTEEEIAVKFAGHSKDIKSLEYRMEEQEEQGKEIRDLADSINKLAINMGHMLEEQKNQGKRLSELESRPGKQWNDIKRTVVTTCISTICGGIVGALIAMII